MSIDFENMELTELTPKIAVIGVGGAGCNAVNNMIAADLQGVDFVVANTDAQALANSQAENRLQLGVQITQGLGAGAQPKIGQAAAEEALDHVDETLEGCHMAFITAGMGGGTGTGAAPVIAKRAREKGILTVGVVTKPFQFEGGRRMKIADAGIAELAANVDTLIIIPNQNLFMVANEKTTFADAFNMADEVLHSGVRGITDLMVMPGLINLDFADVRTVMSEMGKAMMGTGEASGETRAVDAAAAAISNPLLEEASLAGAKGVIINVTGGMDMTLYEVDEAVNMVREQADPDALIVFGSAFSPDLEGKLRVSVVATGIEGNADARPIPQRRTSIEIPVPVTTIEQTPEPTEELSQQLENAEVDGDCVEQQESHTEEQDVPPVDPVENAEMILEEALHIGETPTVEQAVTTEVSEATEQARTVVSETDAIEERAIAARGSDMFVADAPQMPEEDVSVQHVMKTEESLEFDLEDADAPTSYAQEAVMDEEEVEQEQPKRSLFQLMTGGLRPNENKEMIKPQAASNDHETANASLGGMTEEARSIPKSRGQTDQLEIPSFLRRQQN